jgi:NAD(P)-dependent dehydrogenase (short-subunit alcohol dehydrogenase family)
MRLEGKVAVITGCGSGIGLESTYLFAKEGGKIIACDINPTTGQAAVDKINTALALPAPTVVFHPCDVMKEGDIRSAIDLGTFSFTHR